jgi:hypothetical protein
MNNQDLGLSVQITDWFPMNLPVVLIQLICSYLILPASTVVATKTMHRIEKLTKYEGWKFYKILNYVGFVVGNDQCPIFEYLASYLMGLPIHGHWIMRKTDGYQATINNIVYLHVRGTQIKVLTDKEWCDFELCDDKNKKYEIKYSFV